MRGLHEERSAVTLVDDLVRRAIAQGASDIHLEPTQDHLRVRFRLDGVLHDQQPIDRMFVAQLLSRIKVLAHIDIAEKRVPQDGKFQTMYKGKPIDLRVSTFPGLHGEKIVIRILDSTIHALALEQLGFDEQMLTLFYQLIKKPNGFFLVTGPTGSGKTTTLYATLAALHSPEKNIATLEDPVEYNVDGITQGYINPPAGFTFAKGIRALLRQDPDILMVGEIRDKETARIAIEAALTGHLVLSTLHTNDAPSAVMRLIDMGIESFLINAALTGVLAQRLVRKICESCKTERQSSQQERTFCSQFGVEPMETFFVGAGCSACNGVGYKGRIGIFELLYISNELRACIGAQPIFERIYAQAQADGMQTLVVDGIKKAKNGVITLEELMRVVV